MALAAMPVSAQQTQFPVQPRLQPPGQIPGQPPGFVVPNQPQQGQAVPGQARPPGQAQPQPPQVASPLQPPPPSKIKNAVAVFAGLDKITGRIISFDVYMDETVQFGALQVTPRICYSRPLTDAPQTDAFVEVDEITLNRKVQRVFTGWMFASSPGLHAVDNAVYDVWLTDCRMTSAVAPPKR
ncbi:hypothetical protein BH10PSE9_BH10PSE9_21160 [soil metagenome]